MMDDNFHIIDLEKHDTKDIINGHVNGNLTVIWRDWDEIITDPPKMVYVTSINPGEIKGPHLHTKRDSYFTCIRGSVVFVIKDKSGKYIEIESSEEKPTLIHIPKNFPSAHLNSTNQMSTILTLANVAWRPNDDEMKNITFDEYDWKKWKSN